MNDSAEKSITALVLTAVLGCYVFIQVHNFTPGHWEPDLDGYTWLAKRMANGQPLTVRQDNPFRYHDHVWVEPQPGLVTVKYAPGFPALMAVAYRLFGDEGMYYVSPTAGLLLLVGAYLLFRRWMGQPASLLAVATLVLHEGLLFYAGYLLAHIVETCLVTWGMYFLWRWLERPRVASGIGAGLCLGYAVTVRHTSALLALCVAVAVIAALVRQRREARPTGNAGALVALGLAYALFPLLLAWYNQRVFGSPFLTGYAFSAEQGAFAFDIFLRNHRLLLGSTFAQFLFVALPLGFVGAVMVGRWPERLIRLLWIVPLFLLYGCYYWFVPNVSFSRFYFPLLPVLVGMSFALFDHLESAAVNRRMGLALVAVLMGLYSGPAIKRAFTGEMYARHGRAVAQVAREVRGLLKPDAVIFTPERFVHWVGYQNHFEVYDLDAFTKDYGREKFAPLPEDIVEGFYRGQGEVRQQPDRRAWFRTFYARTSAEKLAEFKRALVQELLKSGRQVVFLIPAGSVEREAGGLGPEFSLTKLRELAQVSRRGGPWVVCEVALR